MILPMAPDKLGFRSSGDSTCFEFAAKYLVF